WSAVLHFNATNSTSSLFSGSAVPGIISVANFNVTNYGGSSTVNNYTYSKTGGGPFANDTMTFLGGGTYLTQGWADKTTAIPGSFLGWQYNITLTIWDGGQLNST